MRKGKEEPWLQIVPVAAFGTDHAVPEPFHEYGRFVTVHADHPSLRVFWRAGGGGFEQNQRGRNRTEPTRNPRPQERWSRAKAMGSARTYRAPARRLMSKIRFSS